MRKISSLVCLSTFFLAACSSYSSLPIKPSIEPGSKTMSNQGFSYKISRHILSAKNERAISFLEHIQPIENDEIILDLSKGTKISDVLRDFDLTLIEQMKLLSRPATYRTGDGVLLSDSVTSSTPLPLYVVKANNLDKEDLADFSVLASKQGLSGDFTYDSQATAALVHRTLRLGGYLKDGEKAGQNYKLQQTGPISSTTTEGRNPSSGLYMTSPNTNEFWFTGPKWSTGAYGSDYTYSGCTKSIWGYTTAPGVPVAVLDSGFYAASGDTPQTNWLGTSGTFNTYDFKRNVSSIAGAEDWGDGFWHGRAVASLIFSPQDDSYGTVGAAPGARPYLLNVTSTGQMATAMYNCASWGVKLMNISQGFYSSNITSDPIYNAIQNYVSNGGIVVTSSGNDGDSAYCWPGQFSPYGWVINVGGINKVDGTKSRYGAGGSNSFNVDIWAPGGGGNAANPNLSGLGYDIPVAVAPGSNLQYFRTAQGTSFAAPQVTGVMAAVIARGGRVSNITTAKTYLQSHHTTFPAGWGLDALFAIQ